MSKLKLQTDGGGIPGRPGQGVSYGFILRENRDEGAGEVARGAVCTLNPSLTSNDAEYLGIILGLSYIHGISLLVSPQSITVETDSRLVVGHLTKGWKMDRKFVPYMTTIRVIEDLLELAIHFKHIPRKYNQADSVIRRSLFKGDSR